VNTTKPDDHQRIPWLRPQFWGKPDRGVPSEKHSLNLRRLWKITVLIMTVVSLAPLVVMTAVDYKVTQKSVESELVLRTSRIVSNTKRAVEFSLLERMAALDFIVQDNRFQILTDCARLEAILEHLRLTFGGFVDLGVIDSSGRQLCYVGPYDLAGFDYSEQEWFRSVRDQGMHISDVFPGFRRVPHLVIAARHELPGGEFYVLRTSLEAEFFNTLLSDLELSGNGDAFIVNSQGTLQTSSRMHGEVLDTIDLGVPEYSDSTRVYETRTRGGRAVLIGYAYIPETPFILMIVKQKSVLMGPWRDTRRQLIGFLAVSITGIMIVILAVTTYLVNKIHWADLRRVATLHQVEYTNKMISLGRLGAGVAHEINNPLAIINEKAGLIKDLFSYTDRYADDPKLMGIVDSILKSVKRCSEVTRRLLNFARNTDGETTPVDLAATVTEVLGFMGKEAEYRSIEVKVDIDQNLPTLETNYGRLQQILLNLINNAFAAVDDGGTIEISVRRSTADSITIQVKDNGCGMTEHELARVFEPFYTTKRGRGGTGLGLSITFSLAQELGGSIDVESEPGKGTRFRVTLPLAAERKKGSVDEGTAG
jgi:two-component system NtrC family sensor kinase